MRDILDFDMVDDLRLELAKARRRGDTYRARALVLVKACREERWVTNWLQEAPAQADAFLAEPGAGDGAAAK